MGALEWSASNVLFVTEIDDEHQEIFEALSECRKVFTAGELPEIRRAAEHLANRIEAHFAHEERLMRAARYASLRWHKRRHNGARRRVQAFVRRIEQRDANAAIELADYLTSWLHDHTRVACRMMGAALRNHRRCMGKMSF